ncbi:metal ABC transporter ATP-binding protein [Vaginisenegalia massiliensis]|uniref:metal ABC transporter ATP-binding protein n=1 Tax=Vaginisenegalia massiliensis TaxID=2058294 RepID=UPI000F5266A9|nr:metal ABC transporter ATP-binding protein [Vaginisenegalia massiliensis]
MIECHDVGISYQGQPVLKHINLQINGPTITGIIGPNGAGKSSLIKAILNLVDHSGRIEIKGGRRKEYLTNIGYVQQKAEIDETFPITVKDCVALGTYPSVGLFHRLNPHNWQDVTEALQLVEMQDYAHRQISHLSGGQFQRVLLARCLVQQADYIILDEPFVGIDSISESIMMDTLKKLKSQGKTILIVHHDLSKVKAYFDHLIILNHKLIAYGLTETVFNQKNLILAYGEQIMVKGDVA